MLADDVDLGNGRAAGDEGLVKDHGVFEGDVGVEGEIEERGGSAGYEEEDQGVFAGLAQKRERGAGGGEGAFAGQGMATLEIADAPVALAGNLIGAADAAQALAALHAAEKRVEHGRGGFADSDDEDALEVFQVDYGGAGAFGEEPVHFGALEAQAAIEGGVDAAGVEPVAEDRGGGGVEGFEGEVAGCHRAGLSGTRLCKFSIGFGAAGKVSRSHWPRAACMAGSWPRKKWSAPGIRTSCFGSGAESATERS